jgi:type IV pilus assembly protein PilO
MAPKLQTPNFGALPVGAKIFILFAGIGVITAGYYLGIHMGVEEAAESAKRRYAALEGELQSAKDRQAEYLRLREELSTRLAVDKQMVRVLPETAEIPAFLDDLNRLAELSGLTMGSVSPSPESTSEFYVKVPVSLALTGKYHQLAKFFYNISRLERAINMENIALTAPRIEADEVLLSVSVLATTFRRPGVAGAEGGTP